MVEKPEGQIDLGSSLFQHEGGTAIFDVYSCFCLTALLFAENECLKKCCRREVFQNTKVDNASLS